VTTVEPYDAYAIGDEVWCLAWIGMPFVVVGKNDETRTIQIDGTGPCSLPEGARMDLLPQNHYLLTHEQWDQIWYWPDIAGETYLDVVTRFIDGHRDGSIVTGYAGGSVSVEAKTRGAMTFRLSLCDYLPFGQIKVQPVAAIGDDGSLVVEHDGSIPDDRWQPTGPITPLEIGMHGYRWALTFGRVILSWHDFDD
jgi:hypothetical protein